MKEKMKTRRLENENWYDMNELLWIWPILIWRMVIREWMEYGILRNNQSTQTHAGAISGRLEAWSLEETKTKDPKTENSISGSADQTQTLLHTQCMHYQTQEQKYWNFFRNWIIIDYFMEFSLFSTFWSKHFIILGIFANILS